MSGHRFRPHSAFAALLAGGLLGLALGGCGGSTHPGKLSAVTHPASKAPASGGSTVATAGVKATLVGQDHQPVVGRNWTYTVHVADVDGRPLSGMLETEFTFQGAVVGKDTPPTHRFSHGSFREKLKYPAAATGYPIDLHVVVHTTAGSVTLNWPVTVRK